jgi:predicted lipoprotein with Yx(FWY)xxD motif
MLKRIAIASTVLTLVVSGAAFAATRSGTKVMVHATKYGKVLATSTGRTLYLYTPDRRNKSRCTGACAKAWPPLITKGKPIARKPVKQSLLGTTTRSNGKLQVTYNGHPLYRYVGDTGAGQAYGEGIGGIWFVVTPAGNKK